MELFMKKSKLLMITVAVFTVLSVSACAPLFHGGGHGNGNGGGHSESKGRG